MSPGSSNLNTCFKSLKHSQETAVGCRVDIYHDFKCLCPKFVQVHRTNDQLFDNFDSDQRVKMNLGGTIHLDQELSLDSATGLMFL